MSFVLSQFSAVNLHHIKLISYFVPVEYPFHARPAAPLQAPPTRTGVPASCLRDPRDVNVGAVHLQIAPARTPACPCDVGGDGCGGFRRCILLPPRWRLASRALRSTSFSAALARQGRCSHTRLLVFLPVLGPLKIICRVWPVKDAIVSP